MEAKYITGLQRTKGMFFGWDANGNPESQYPTTGITDILYADLVTGLDVGGDLVTGYYRITDYVTEYYMPSTLDLYGIGVRLSTTNIAPTVEPLIVFVSKAPTVYAQGEIDKLAFSELYPDDIIHYTLSNSKLNGATKGVIYYRESGVNVCPINTSAHFDFRNVGYRRYELDLSGKAWAVGTTYAKWAVVAYNGDIYVSKKAANVGIEPTVTTDWAESWQLIITAYAGKYISWTKDNFIIANVTIPVNNASYFDRNIFSDVSGNVNWGNVKNVHIDSAMDVNFSFNPDLILNNILFDVSNIYDGVVIKKGCFGANIGQGQANVTIGENSYSFIIGDGCTDTEFKSKFNNSIIGDSFGFNTIETNCVNLLLGSSIGNINILQSSSDIILGNGVFRVYISSANQRIVLGDNVNNINIDKNNGAGNGIIIEGVSSEINIGSNNTCDIILKNAQRVSIGDSNLQSIAVLATSGSTDIHIGSNNTHAITIGDSCFRITVGSRNTNVITIGDFNVDVSIGDGNIGVSVGDSNNQLTIGNLNSVITVEDGTANCRIGDTNNTITFKDSCSNITVKDSCTSFEVPANSQKNVFENLTNSLTFFTPPYIAAPLLDNVFHSATGLDFSSATHVFNDYHCEIMKAATSGDFYLTYIDSAAPTVVSVALATT